jgi:hypothetical protein
MMTIDGDDVDDDIIIMDIDEEWSGDHSLKKKDTTIKKTHHHINQLRNDLDKGPDPFSVGLRVDGAVGRADGRTPRALLGVNL